MKVVFKVPVRLKAVFGDVSELVFERQEMLSGMIESNLRQVVAVRVALCINQFIWPLSANSLKYRQAKLYNNFIFGERGQCTLAYPYTDIQDYGKKTVVGCVASPQKLWIYLSSVTKQQSDTYFLLNALALINEQILDLSTKLKTDVSRFELESYAGFFTFFLRYRNDHPKLTGIHY